MWRKIKSCGKALIITTLTQFIGTIAAAIINEIIAVIIEKRFDWAGELNEK